MCNENTSFHKFCIENGHGEYEEYLFSEWFKGYLSRFFSYSYQAYTHLANTMEAWDVETYWKKYQSEKRYEETIKEE